MDKNAYLNPTHAFAPVVIEMSGLFGPQTWGFVNSPALICQLDQVTGDERSTVYLLAPKALMQC